MLARHCMLTVSISQRYILESGYCDIGTCCNIVFEKFWKILKVIYGIAPCVDSKNEHKYGKQTHWESSVGLK